jgi:transcriptional regulator with XRE-family HTH domain
MQKLLGARLKDARTKLRMSQDALANACELSRTHITRIEAGTVNPSLETADTLARAVGLNLVDLLDPSDELSQASKLSQEPEQQVQTSGTLPTQKGVLAIEMPERDALEGAVAAAKKIGKPLHLIEPASREIRAVVSK